MVVYADVLVAVNLYINYFLIRATCLILRRAVVPLRAVLASAVGAAGSLLFLLPELHPVLGVLLKCALGVLVTLAAFGRQKRADFLLSLLCFLAVSFAFAGGMLALWYFAAPAGMLCKNGFTYFDIPIGAAAVITAAVYGIFRLIRYIMSRSRPKQHEKVLICCQGKKVTLDGLADTGNALTDSFTGKPVVIASLNAAREVIPPNVLDYLSGRLDGIEGIRLIPCRTVTSEGVIPAFPAQLVIGGKPIEALLGVSRQELTGAQCIFDPSIII